VTDHPSITEVKLSHGVVVSRFFDPPHYPPGATPGGKPAPAPVERWRVRLPKWFPSGSWLDGEHSFPSLSAVLRALDETGALAAIAELWRANQEASRAQRAAFSKIMAAHGMRDESYDKFRRDRAERVRRSLMWTSLVVGQPATIQTRGLHPNAAGVVVEKVGTADGGYVVVRSGGRDVNIPASHIMP
jgi:hypothetical protein